MSLDQLDAVADIVHANAKAGSVPTEKPQLHALLQVKDSHGLTPDAFEEYALCDLNLARQLQQPFSSKYGASRRGSL